mgnify:CR=1 FL=1
MPYIISIQSTSGNFSCPYTQPTTDENRTITKTLTETYESAKIEDNTSNDVITDDDEVVEGEQQPEEEVEMVTHTIVTNYTITQNYNFEKFTETENAPSASQTYHRVPNHAHSVLLQIVNSGQLSFSTSKSFDENLEMIGTGIDLIDNCVDEKCTVDVALRRYLISNELPPELKIYYWIYPYKTINIIRDVVAGSVLETRFPKGMISVIAAFPIAFMIAMDDDSKILPNLLDCLDMNKIPLNMRTMIDPVTNKIRDYLWPCNIGNDKGDASFVLAGSAGAESSRIGIHEI